MQLKKNLNIIFQTFSGIISRTFPFAACYATHSNTTHNRSIFPATGFPPTTTNGTSQYDRFTAYQIRREKRKSGSPRSAGDAPLKIPRTL
jgi:hypothetical protein